jgi:hypothetical protein
MLTQYLFNLFSNFQKIDLFPLFRGLGDFVKRKA